MRKEHILIIRFSALGDVAMTVPVVKSLAEQYPNIRITVLSKPFAHIFFKNLAPNVGFMGADVSGEYHGVKGLNALYRRLSAKHFTAIADLHDTLRSKYLRMCFNLGSTRVKHIDKKKIGKRHLTSKNHKILIQQPTSFENYAEVFEKLGYPVSINFSSIYAGQSVDLTDIHQKTGRKKLNEKWIGIAPFAAHKGKIYPLSKTESITRMLIERHPHIKIFLFGGGKSERKLLDEWTKKYERCINVSTIFDCLQKELALMSQLDVMLSMDSANMHLASLVATPVVSIWGATHPFAGFMGWNQSEENVVQTELDCRPCSIYGKKACFRGDYACLYNIAPQTVIEKIEKIIFQ